MTAANADPRDRNPSFDTTMIDHLDHLVLTTDHEAERDLNLIEISEPVNPAFAP
jgi:hypothetical protein